MNTKSNHPIATPSEWLATRAELLAEEKQLTRQMDALAAKRRALPWVKIEKDYRFRQPPRTSFARGPLRRAKPAGHPALHVRTGLAGGLRRLLVHG